MDRKLLQMIFAGVVSGLIIVTIQRKFAPENQLATRANQGVWV
jgi:hypothetical protein